MSRPPAPLVFQQFMDILSDLLVRLKHTGGKEGAMSPIEAYQHFITGENGRNCRLAIRARSLFENQDYQQVKELLLKAVELIEEIEAEAELTQLK